jgi:DNA topoisomerase-3
MPDFRYRQTTATVDVQGHLFKATGRQPIEHGWRAAFPDWRPTEERGDDAQLLPAMRDREPTRLGEPKVESKETKAPPRYHEGTLIDAMQNAWRFVADETLRERLKEAKGIGPPATRGEIIRGLKAQEFLSPDGKHIVPTERGLVLYGILERADPALVDPGVTAQMERLLDDVLVGRQDMMSAIDAVCDQASRIIGRLTERGASDTILNTAATSAGPQRFQHIPSPRSSGSVRSKSVTPRTRSKAALGRDAAAPPIATDTGAKRRRSTRSLSAIAEPAHAHPTPPDRKGRPSKIPVSSKDLGGGRSIRPVKSAGSDLSNEETPLRIPFGNKEAAQALGARYRAGGWYAPANLSLTAFRERGWLWQ